MLSIAILGLGVRGGDVYGNYAYEHAEKFRIAAICDIDAEKRQKFGEKWGIEPSKIFDTAENFFAAGKLADVLFVCTRDKQHYRHAMSGLETGYHLVLEKPVALAEEECSALEKRAGELKRVVVVENGLRYEPYFRTIKKLVEEKAVGELIGVEHTENIGAWHYAHSYIRGNWCNTVKAGPLILSKCSHDFDMLYWLIGKKCTSVYSKGELNYFTSQHAPEGAALRCLSCPYCETCEYSAKRIYLDGVAALEKQGKSADVRPFNVVARSPSSASIKRALEGGDYGRCVYFSDNNVADEQITIMNFGEVYTVLTATAFSRETYRRTVLRGTNGCIEADDLTNVIAVKKYGAPPEEISVAVSDSPFERNGDAAFMEYAYAVLGGTVDETACKLFKQSLHGHEIAFAAEKSRADDMPVGL